MDDGRRGKHAGVVRAKQIRRDNGEMRVTRRLSQEGNACIEIVTTRRHGGSPRTAHRSQDELRAALRNRVHRGARPEERVARIDCENRTLGALLFDRRLAPGQTARRAVLSAAGADFADVVPRKHEGE